MDRLLQITRNDFEESIRNRELFVAGVLFVLVGLAIGYIVGNTGGGAPANGVAMLGLGGLTFIGAVASIALSYNQIVGKRTSGELRVLLSLPYSRLEVVYGSLLGRWLALTAMAALSLVVAAAVAALLGAPVAVIPLFGTLVALAALIAVFVSLSIGLSAGTENTTRAAAGAFGLLIVFLLRLWEAMPIPVRYVLNGFKSPSGPAPTWANAWGHLAPIAGLRNAVAGPMPEPARFLSGYAAGVPEGDPVYAEPWFGAVVVLAWIVLPVTLGFLTFRRADL